MPTVFVSVFQLPSIEKGLNPTYNQQVHSQKLSMTREMQLWHGLVIAAVSLFLQACLLIATSYLLSRHIAQQSERLLKKARLQAPGPSPTHHAPPAAKETKEAWTERSTPVPAPHYRHGSDTSSDSTDSSDSSDTSPPTCQATKEVNYTQVVFSATGGVNMKPAVDYENIKEAPDYVNVNPKSHNLNFWALMKSDCSEPVEYTQVVI
ncbi:regulator of hemoglobinization and erythroid cell expansion protein [Ctenodactylus gundi]